MHLGTFVVIFLRGNVNVFFGRTKTWIPRIVIFLNLQLQDVHRIFDTDPSVLKGLPLWHIPSTVVSFKFVYKTIFQ